MTRALVRALAVAAILAPGPAAAFRLKSLYTTVELQSCKQVKRHPDGGAWHCNGLAGYPVYVAEGDLRQFVSFGEDAAARRAATQTLGPFNSIFERGSRRATIEWRFVRRDGRPIPFAAILRFHTFQEGRRGQVLVVFKVSPSESCHVAYVDALANPEAIALARKAADETARAFDCSNEASALGATGRSPM